MGKRKYFILSLLLVVCALCSDSASKAYFSKSNVLLAKSLLSISQADKEQAKIQRDEFTRKGHIFGYIGIVLASLSFAFWIASEVRHEPTWRLILPVLLCLYLLLQFVMV